MCSSDLTAVLVAGLGADVTVAGRSAQRLEETQALLPGSAAVSVDVSDHAALTAALTAARPDHVVLSTGAAYYNTIRDLEIEPAAEFIRDRFVTPLVIGKWIAAECPALSSLTIVGGIILKRPVVGAAAWSFAGPGVLGLVETLALELAPTRVNTIAPGFVADSPMNARLQGAQAADDQRRHLEQVLPTKRTVTVADCARQILAVMTDPAVTGTKRDVDGGHALIA